jgi:hypothetical protein
MIKVFLFLWLVFPSVFYAQSKTYPIYEECKSSEISAIEECFLSSTKKRFFSKFKIPKIVVEENYQGTLKVQYAVTKKGSFRIICIKTPLKEIKKEVKRVFKGFKKITPAKYNDRDIKMKFELSVKFPIIEYVRIRPTKDVKKSL